eukprot:TRINITY_DN1759_c0_g1_i1.p1 TRINITY_DN1759_c0_g1~~TRINITY_DN1759_c0_g1_i1.p1  ORF type:complete len:249 (+),score=46.87 TRINITY_DN1759_c0_g1_i1:50-796(+)
MGIEQLPNGNVEGSEEQDSTDLNQILDNLTAQSRYCDSHSERLLWIFIPICFSFVIREMYDRKWRQFCAERSNLVRELIVFERENGAILQSPVQNNGRDDNFNVMRNDVPVPPNLSPERELQFLQIRTKIISHFNYVLSCVFCMLFCSCLPIGFQFKVLMEILVEDYSHLATRILPKVIRALLLDFLGVSGSPTSTQHFLPSSLYIWVLNVHMICFADLISRLRIFATFSLLYVDYHMIPISPPNCAG